MLLLFCNKFDAGALTVVVAIMADPGIAEHLVAEAVFVAFDFRVVGIARGGLAGRNLEGVRRGPHADDRAAAGEVVGDVGHLFAAGGLRKRAKMTNRSASLSASIPDRFEEPASMLPFASTPKIDGAFETVGFRQNAGESRAGLLAAVFVIGGDEDDVFPSPAPPPPAG